MFGGVATCLDSRRHIDPNRSSLDVVWLRAAQHLFYLCCARLRQVAPVSCKAIIVFASAPSARNSRLLTTHSTVRFDRPNGFDSRVLISMPLHWHPHIEQMEDNFDRCKLARPVALKNLARDIGWHGLLGILGQFSFCLSPASRFSNVVRLGVHRDTPEKSRPRRSRPSKWRIGNAILSLNHRNFTKAVCLSSCSKVFGTLPCKKYA